MCQLLGWVSFKKQKELFNIGFAVFAIFFLHRESIFIIRWQPEEQILSFREQEKTFGPFFQLQRIAIK